MTRLSRREYILRYGQIAKMKEFMMSTPQRFTVYIPIALKQLTGDKQ